MASTNMNLLLELVIALGLRNQPMSTTRAETRTLMILLEQNRDNNWAENLQDFEDRQTDPEYSFWTLEGYIAVCDRCKVCPSSLYVLDTYTRKLR